MLMISTHDGVSMVHDDTAGRLAWDDLLRRQYWCSVNVGASGSGLWDYRGGDWFFVNREDAMMFMMVWA